MEIFDTVGHGQGGWADAATGELDAIRVTLTGVLVRRATYCSPL